MRSSLSNSGRSSVVRILVDGRLKLLKELVNVDEIALSPQVGKRKRVLVLRNSMDSG